MKRYLEYDRHKEVRLSCILAMIGIVITSLCIFVMQKQALGAGMMVMTLIMANQHEIGRSLSIKNLKRSIQRAFPGWLMDIILLLQSENVQVAFVKSKEHVPVVLAHEVETLVDQIEMESSNRADQQISELIERNLTMLDVAEKERLANLSSGMYLLFLAPVVTASLKLVTDMAIFMLSFLTSGNLAAMG